MIRIDVAGEADLPKGRRLTLTNYYPARHGISNLVCLGPDGQPVWEAELGDPYGGHYVYVEIDAGRIFASSWDGYRMELAPESGRIVSRTFTK